jgi:uncharacterized C2H2 Zn-finger protein
MTTTKFKVGEEFLFFGQKANITQVNEDGTYNFEYCMEIFKDEKFYCKNVTEEHILKLKGVK